MYFKRKGSEYFMYTLEVVKLVISSKHLGTISVIKKDFSFHSLTIKFSFKV